MTEDIVTRLRNETDDFHIFNLVIEAADEIERLRAERSYRHGQYESALRLMDELDELMRTFHEDYQIARLASHSSSAANTTQRLADADARHRLFEMHLQMKRDYEETQDIHSV